MKIEVDKSLKLYKFCTKINLNTNHKKLVEK